MEQLSRSEEAGHGSPLGVQPRRHPARDRRAAAARMPLGRLYAAQFFAPS